MFEGVIVLGGDCPGVNFPIGNFPGDKYPRGGGVFVPLLIVQGVIVLGTYYRFFLKCYGIISL